MQFTNVAGWEITFKYTHIYKHRKPSYEDFTCTKTYAGTDLVTLLNHLNSLYYDLVFIKIKRKFIELEEK